MLNKHQTVCVIGLGYIGLPTAAVLASSGYQVIGVDINPDIVEAVSAGKAHIAETDLDMLVRASVASGALEARTKPEAVDVYIVAVPTPLNADKSPDISCVEKAFDSIAPHLKVGDLVILESTCPVGTTDAMAKRLDRLRPDLGQRIYAAYCPERVLPGQILRELIENDRVVGGVTPHATEQAIKFYSTFVNGVCLPTDARTAEMCKLTENTFRDVSIAFANEVSIICDELDIDVWQLIRLANHHPRVNLLQPGCGVGGHCIAVDPWFMVNQAPETSKLIQAARTVNNAKPQWVSEKIIAAVEEYQEQTGMLPIIACLGVTFKANVDDTRESPALAVVTRIAEEYPNHVWVVEPNLAELPDTLSGTKIRITTFDHACQEADLLAVLVDHVEFKNRIAKHKANQVALDFKGLWSKQ